MGIRTTKINKSSMQSLRSTIRRAPQQLNRITKPTITTTRHFTTTPATMSLFPRFTQEFAPIFRLFDEYDRQAFRNIDREFNNIRSFTPKFDVKETKEGYELHGELPGVEQKDINIEWTDNNTLTISGRHEHVREEGQRPQGFIENGESSQQSENKEKYWVSESSVGEFHRSFAIPARVDQDSVKASLKNGILSILVPKAQAPQPRKISIE